MKNIELISITFVFSFSLASCLNSPEEVRKNPANLSALTATAFVSPTATPLVSPTPSSGISSSGSDPLFTQQWFMVNTGQSSFSSGFATAGKDINFKGTVAQGFTGSGVHILVSDDGFEVTHEDLSANYDATRSRDYTVAPPYSGGGDHKSSTDGHGTAVSGIIGAIGFNYLGGRGIAPQVKLSSANFLSDKVIRKISMMVDQANTTADIVNQSWGSEQDYIQDINQSYLAQLQSAVMNGRSAKGTLFVKAAGNSFTMDFGNNIYRVGNSNFDGDSNTPYTITVAALDSSDKSASYSSPGANIWISAYGGGSGISTPAIVTTDRSGCTFGFAQTTSTAKFDAGKDVNNTNCNYTSTMNGTSSAAPMVSGVLALMLEANSNLGWREVKHILALTATKVSPQMTIAKNPYVNSPSGHTWEHGWVTNAAGIKFHNWFGFGKVNTDAAVAMAKNYSVSLGTLSSTTNQTTGQWLFESGSISQSIPDNSASGTSATLAVKSNYIIEHVQIKLSATHGNIGDLGIELTSPGGTKSILKNMNDSLYELSDFNNDTFSSNAFYGESSQGTWTLKVIDGAPSSTGTLTSWKINILGH